MKRYITATLFSLVMCGCVTPRVLRVQNPEVYVKPLEVSVEVGERITGETLCSLGEQSYIDYSDGSQTDSIVVTKANIDTETAVSPSQLIPTACRNAAVYNALTASGADVIVMPKYFIKPVSGKKLYKTGDSTVKVTGFKGMYKDFKDKPPVVITLGVGEQQAGTMTKELERIK